MRRTRRNTSQLLLPNQLNADFQCPYCRCMSNTIIPLIVPLSKISAPKVIHTGDEVFPIDSWIEVMRVFSDYMQLVAPPANAAKWLTTLPHWLQMFNEAHVLADSLLFENMAQMIKPPSLPLTWSYFVHQFIKGVNKLEDLDVVGMWETCIYTIQSLEVYLREIGKPLKYEMSIRHRSCLSGLIRCCCVYTAVMTEESREKLIAPVNDLLNVVFNQEGESVLEWDCFEKMLLTLFMVPNMFFIQDGE